MKTYEAIFDKSDNKKGVFNISLVKNPAMQEYFIALSEDEKKDIKEAKVQFTTVDKEERLLIGLVLEPNKLIRRSGADGQEDFNVTFSAETIKELSHSFFKNNFHNQSTIEHEDGTILKDVHFVESWNVADSKKDKSAAYGLEYPIGSWVVTMKVESDEVWEGYIKTGAVKGFSIDALVELKEVKTKNNLSMSVLKKLELAAEKIVALFEDKEAEKVVEVKLGTIGMEGGEVTFEYEGETFEAGVKVFAIDKEDETVKVPVPIGQYPLEDGKILIVTEDGVVGEIKDPNAEDEAPETPADAPADVEASGDSEAIQKIQSILIKYGEKLDTLVEMKKDIDALKGEVLEMSEQEITPKKNSTPQVVVKLNKQGRMLNALRQA